MKFSLYLSAIIALLSVNACTSQKKKTTNEVSEKKKMNVLFISIDDLRPELGCYGNKQVYSPNIDAIASKGMVFQNAHCQQAVCAPSRNSIMTGLRPDSLKIYDLGTNFRTTCPDVVTLPQYFIQNGYHAECSGKIYHIWHGNKDDEASWSIPPWNPWHEKDNRPKVERNDTTELQSSRPKYKDKLLAWNRSEFDMSYEQDSKITSHVIERLAKLKDTSFFMGVGFLKPHLPFIAPKKFWDIYDTVDVHVPDKDLPKGAPSFAMNDDGELTCCYYGFDTVQFPIPDAWAKEMIRGYYSCVSFIDYQVGQLTSALDSLGLAENTMIVIWGDHGWKLGEYGHWCKHTAYEVDTRTTLIVKVPGKQTTVHTCNELVEMLDIYPTVVEETGLGLPEHLMGKSLSSLLENPDNKHKEAVLSQWPGPNNLMGYSLRTKRFRYVQWEDKSTGEIKAQELYDHITDPKEQVNVIADTKYSKYLQPIYNSLKAVRGSR